MLLHHLRTLLASHQPLDDQEAAHLAAMRSLVDLERPCSRSTEEPGHFTASAFVLSPEGDAILLIEHAKLGLWLQPGGHIDDTDADLFAAARREVEEETGLGDLVVAPGFPILLDVDVHEIPANPRKGEGPHKHFDVRVLLQSSTREVQAGSDALAARWVDLDAVEQEDTDASVLRAVGKLRARRARLAASEPRHAPATERNREPIFDVLRGIVNRGERVLEIASGTGQHAAWLAHRLGVTWQPSDLGDEALASIEQHRSDAVRPPVRLDARWQVWPVLGADVVFSANMVHISPWACTLGLLDGAARTLEPGGRLVLYGPYRVAGAHTAASNANFDASLRNRDPSWGVRDLEAVVAEAGARGLMWTRTVPMPANNFIVVFER